jgi:CRISPR-associated protein Cmr2
VAADWDLLIRVLLYDPPDEALDIRGHEGRAARYLAAALGREIDAATVKADASLADTLEAIAERLPMPTAGKNGAPAISPENGQLQIHHPLGSNPHAETVPALNEVGVERAIRSIVDGIEDRRPRFLALWRLLPEKLAELHPVYAVLPADPRVPDHTIWHQADAATVLLPAGSGAGAALLSFAIAPVQGFIEAARSLRDLWSGSLILSWLAFKALLPIVEEVGPQALIFPYLRGNPLLDRWLRENARLEKKIIPPSEEASRTPSLPNRFLALVPESTGPGLVRRCEEAARNAWRDLAEDVRRQLNLRLSGCPGWDDLWRTQIEEYWEIRSSVLPYRSDSGDDLAGLSGIGSFAEAWPEAARIRELADLIPEGERPRYDQKQAGRWQATVDLAGRALEARRSIRHVPRNAVPSGSEVAEKCALLGTVERMGPANRAENRKFWETLSPSRDSGRQPIRIGGVQLRPREYFSAVALIKRFALPVRLADELGLGRHRFPDTATVAARLWLDRADPELTWPEGGNGQWLYWRKPDQDEDEEAVDPPALWDRIRRARDKHGWPPAYLAVLVMDGDHMGKWLRGEKNPKVGAAIHPKMRDYFSRRGGGAVLDGVQRPVGPALHAAISQALSNFAIHIAPGIVERHQGELVYAGGDDLLALLPTQKAIACAAALNAAFAKENGYVQDAEGKERLVMGKCATLSAGIAVVHHKEDLRVALVLARQAERAAKQAGRNRLHLFIARRSGERAGQTLGWGECDAMNTAVEAFAADASDRWAYRLRKLVPSLPPVPEAFRLELKRQLGRSDKATQEALVAWLRRASFRLTGARRKPSCSCGRRRRSWRAVATKAETTDGGAHRPRA